MKMSFETSNGTKVSFDDVTPEQAVALLTLTFTEKPKTPDTEPNITLVPAVRAYVKKTVAKPKKRKSKPLTDFKAILGMPLKHYTLAHKDQMSYPILVADVINKVAQSRRVTHNVRRAIRVNIYETLKSAGVLHVTE